MLAIVKGPNPLLRIGHNVILKSKRRNQPQNISRGPEIYHLETQLTFSLRDKFRNCSWRRRRESGASLGEDLLY
jgi:hypothetical protein